MPKIVTEDDRSRKRRAILDAAAAEIAAYGYERANINTIAERAGIGRGTIYLYFASKDDLLNALLDAIGELLDETVRACVETDAPWEQRLRVLTRSFADLAYEHRDFFRVQVSALHGVNRAIGAPLANWLQQSVERLAHAVRAAQAEGALADLPAEHLAALLLGLLESAALVPGDSLAEGDGHYARADTLAALLWGGLAPRSRDTQPPAKTPASCRQPHPTSRSQEEDQL